MRILIVEDDNDINSLLYEMLSNEGYDVKSAYSGTEGLLYLDNNEFDLILLDLMLPGKAGDELVSIIREKKNMPIIIISAKEEVGLKAKLLRAGADDFINKPFDLDEVLARIVANGRRYIEFSNNNEEINIIKYKEITINKETREVFINSTAINLTVREFDILELLIKHPTKVFSKANLFKSVWKDEYFGDDNTITVHISNLRNKIIKAGAKLEYIKTIWGIGYKMDV